GIQCSSTAAKTGSVWAGEEPRNNVSSPPSPRTFTLTASGVSASLPHLPHPLHHRLHYPGPPLPSTPLPPPPPPSLHATPPCHWPLPPPPPRSQRPCYLRLCLYHPAPIVTHRTSALPPPTAPLPPPTNANAYT
ncbi:hypothetical protein Vafri_14494, partial [Volvox africanus]